MIDLNTHQLWIRVAQEDFEAQRSRLRQWFQEHDLLAVWPTITRAGYGNEYLIPVQGDEWWIVLFLLTFGGLISRQARTV